MHGVFLLCSFKTKKVLHHTIFTSKKSGPALFMLLLKSWNCHGVSTFQTPSILRVVGLKRGKMKGSPTDVLWVFMVGQPTMLISLRRRLSIFCFLFSKRRQCAWQAHSDFIFCPQSRQIQVSGAVADALHPPPRGKWHRWLLEEHKETWTQEIRLKQLAHSTCLQKTAKKKVCKGDFCYWCISLRRVQNSWQSPYLTASLEGCVQKYLSLMNILVYNYQQIYLQKNNGKWKLAGWKWNEMKWKGEWHVNVSWLFMMKKAETLTLI